MGLNHCRTRLQRAALPAELLRQTLQMSRRRSINHRAQRRRLTAFLVSLDKSISAEAERHENWSGRRGSNSRHLRRQRSILPLNYARKLRNSLRISVLPPGLEPGIFCVSSRRLRRLAMATRRCARPRKDDESLRLQLKSTEPPRLFRSLQGRPRWALPGSSTSTFSGITRLIVFGHGRLFRGGGSSSRRATRQLHRHLPCGQFGLADPMTSLLATLLGLRLWRTFIRMKREGFDHLHSSQERTLRFNSMPL